MAFKEVVMTVVDLKKYPDRSLSGYYLGSNVREGKRGEFLTHEFQLEPSNEPISIFGFASLDAKMKRVEPGVLCQVTYRGMEKRETKHGTCDVHQVTVLADTDRRIKIDHQPISQDGDTHAAASMIPELPLARTTAKADDEDLPF